MSKPMFAAQNFIQPAGSNGTVSFVNHGIAVTATTTPSVRYPPSLVTGNLLIIYCVSKIPSNVIDTPSGWTAASNSSIAGGAGAAGNAQGQVQVQMFYKIADGSETSSGTLNLSWTPSTGNIMMSFMFQFSKSSGTWNVVMDGNSFNGSTSPVSPSSDGRVRITTPSTIAIGAGDYVLAGIGNTSTAGSATIGGSEYLNATGITFGTITIEHNSTTTGNDVRIIFEHAAVSAGSANVAVTAGVDIVSSALSPSGAGVIARIRAAA